MSKLKKAINKAWQAKGVDNGGFLDGLQLSTSLGNGRQARGPLLTEEINPTYTRTRVEHTAAEVLRFRDRAFDDYFSDPRYLKMIETRFGSATVAHIKQMCSVKLRRKYYDFDDGKRFESVVK